MGLYERSFIEQKTDFLLGTMSNMKKKSDSATWETRTVFGKETRFNGVLRYQESLKINGYFEGIIESPGFLMVTSSAVVQADVRMGTLVVGGKIKGNVQVSDRLIVLAGGQIIGNVRCPNLLVAEGTILQGMWEMIVAPENVDIFSMSSEALKKTVTRVV